MAENAPDKCYDCEWYRRDQSLEYYPYPYCGKCGYEISFGLKDGDYRMKWCPLMTDDEQKAELLEKIKKVQTEIHEFMICRQKRNEEPMRFEFLVSTLIDRLDDASKIIKCGNLYLKRRER